MNATLVLDIGKTNAKLVLIDAAGTVLAERRRANRILDLPPYPQHDTDALWAWMLTTMAELNALARIGAIVPVTHGATGALVDHEGLVLPVLDYEAAQPSLDDKEYQQLRPDFGAACSPALPAGLNLGRQLAWQARTFPEQFARARHLLMYPQYWAWRLCGVAAGEITSLGCHTDLWLPNQQAYSPLVARMGLDRLMPPLRPAWSSLGAVKPDVCELTGLDPQCQVLCGIHDSNASLLRHIGNGTGAVLSSGTWLIAASFGTPLDALREADDMLANTTALGQPVACMRFMGGREFAELAGADPVQCSLATLQSVIDRKTHALPCFAEAGGPFAGRSGAIIGPPPATSEERYALATLYCALMSDYCLDTLHSSGSIVVEGSFGANPHFAPLLAALRERQQVLLSDDASGTTRGAWMLHHWGEAVNAEALPAAPAPLAGLRAYRAQWRGLLARPAG